MVELDYRLIQDRPENEVYPSVIDCLHGKASLEVKYRACCITRTLARDAGFAARIKKESLFLLRQLRDSSGKLRVRLSTDEDPGHAEPCICQKTCLCVL